MYQVFTGCGWTWYGSSIDLRPVILLSNIVFHKKTTPLIFYYIFVKLYFLIPSLKSRHL